MNTSIFTKHNSQISLLILFICSAIVTAQPTLTTDLVPTIGTRVDAKFLIPDNFDPGPAGPNVNWDFSDLDAAFDIHFQIIDPATAPGNDSFPSADFVWHFEEFENYVFYSSSADTIHQLGGTTGSVDDITFMTVNYNTEDGLHLPVSYNDQYDYDAAFRNYLFGSFSSQGTRDGRVHADGFGTIKTSFGTYTNVLRLKIVNLVREEVTSTQYAWFHPDSFIPVLVYEEYTDPEEEPSLYYSDIESIISSSENISTFNGSISAKYDKSMDQLMIHMNVNESLDRVQFQLINSSGQQVHTQDLGSASTGQNQYAIHIPTTITQGIYFVRITTLEHRWAQALYIGNN